VLESRRLQTPLRGMSEDSVASARSSLCLVAISMAKPSHPPGRSHWSALVPRMRAT